jgi:hypothetical protein
MFKFFNSLLVIFCLTVTTISSALYSVNGSDCDNIIRVTYQNNTRDYNRRATTENAQRCLADAGYWDYRDANGKLVFTGIYLDITQTKAEQYIKDMDTPPPTKVTPNTQVAEPNIQVQPDPKVVEPKTEVAGVNTINTGALLSNAKVIPSSEVSKNPVTQKNSNMSNTENNWLSYLIKILFAIIILVLVFYIFYILVSFFKMTIK